jgi:hypothetical protein
MEEFILTKAKELFFSCGIKGVSMDDISSYDINNDECCS